MEDRLKVVAMTDDDGNGIGKFGSQAHGLFLFWLFSSILRPIWLLVLRANESIYILRDDVERAEADRWKKNLKCRGKAENAQTES